MHINNTIYVDANAPGAGTGLSWTDAYTTVQDALDAAAYGDEIWVAEGIYTPTNVIGSEATFVLTDGIALYGGFGGFGISETLRTQRDWENQITVLSGDLDGNDTTDANGVIKDAAGIVGNNARHVVSSNEATESTVLDGFIITGGDARGSNEGGGMYTDNSSPVLVNVIFSGNVATYGGGMFNGNSSSPTLVNVTFISNISSNMGGGMLNSSSAPVLVNVIFSGNTAANRGGGMLNSSSAPTLVNVVFNGNTATGRGGGMSNWNSNPTLVNTTFDGNVVGGTGGGMFNTGTGAGSTPTIQNSIFWHNQDNDGMDASAQIHNEVGTPVISYTLVQASGGSGADWVSELGIDGDGNLDTDPLFVDWDGADDTIGTLDDDLRLRPTSPAIDAADNTAVSLDAVDLDGDGDMVERMPLDLAGNARFIDVYVQPDTGNGVPPIVDMGAYEALWFFNYLPLVRRDQ
jgi:hypothetical protein